MPKNWVWICLTGQDDDGTVEASLKSSHLEDSSDCVKRLLCELQAIKDRDLSWDEYVIKKSILPVLDYSSPTLQFNIAADVGRQEGIDQCSIVYNRSVDKTPGIKKTLKFGRFFFRCVFDSSDIMKLMRQRGTSLELPTNDNYECTVLFLWNKKRPSTNRPVEFPTSIADYGRSGF